jgi:hypothetical protein
MRLPPSYLPVILVLGTRIHEFASAAEYCPSKLVDGRAKHDHDDEGSGYKLLKRDRYAL